VKNAAFFFTNLEFGRKQTPSGFSADGSSGQNGFSPQVSSLRHPEGKCSYDAAAGGRPRRIHAWAEQQQVLRAIRLQPFDQAPPRPATTTSTPSGRRFPVDASFKFPDNFYRIATRPTRSWAS
jgi:hypothetical protein